VSHILFIRKNPLIPQSLREVFPALEQRIVIRQSADEVESALNRGAFELSVIYADAGADYLEQQLRSIKSSQPGLETIVLSPVANATLEEIAFLKGADLYFTEPLSALSLSRLLQKNAVSAPLRPQPAAREPATEPAARGVASTLHLMRDLSRILSYSLDYKAFTQHFILKLRDHVNFGRIGIFLQNSGKQSIVKQASSDHLACIASIGLPTDLVECFQLSRKLGIGLEISCEPRILHHQRGLRGADSVESNAIQKEFSILGCSIAIPISDREGNIGVAVLSGPVTDRSYTEEELELLYLLMEELGLAIRNSRLHTELAQHGRFIENVLHSMASGAIVFSEDLRVLYINDAAKRFLQFAGNSSDLEVSFADLPNQLAGAVHRAVEKGELPEPFLMPDTSGEQIFRVSVFPIAQKGEIVLLPRPTMVILEDYTVIEAKKIEAINRTKNQTIRLMAERFAHEIRNSLVPLSTHAQLMDQMLEQPSFQKSLKSSLLAETARIRRFSEQMLYMAQYSHTSDDSVEPGRLIEESFDRARGNSGRTEANLSLENNCCGGALRGNSEALGFALEEIFLNSLQASPEKPEVRVHLAENQEGIFFIQIRDGGPGLREEQLDQLTEPFYTTRNTGVGLGLSVAQKIISEHDGFLRLYAREKGHPCDIEIELPLLLVTQ